MVKLGVGISYEKEKRPLASGSRPDRSARPRCSVEINNCTKQHQTRPHCDHDQSKQKHDHSCLNTDRSKNIFQTTKITRDCPISLANMEAASLPITALAFLLLHSSHLVDKICLYPVIESSPFPDNLQSRAMTHFPYPNHPMQAKSTSPSQHLTERCSAICILCCIEQYTPSSTTEVFLMVFELEALTFMSRVGGSLRRRSWSYRGSVPRGQMEGEVERQAEFKFH